MRIGSGGSGRSVRLGALAGLGIGFVLASSARGQATEQQSLTPATGTLYQEFGSSVATSGDVMVVGAPFDSTKAFQAGTAFILRRSAVTGLWAQEKQLFASDFEYDARFGTAVAADGDKVVVTAKAKDTAKGVDAGQVYVYRYDAVTKLWNEEQKLVPSGGKAGDGFGFSVAISGDSLVVGANNVDFGGLVDAGAAYVFRWQDPTVKWIEEGQLLDSNAWHGDQAGRSVGIDGSTAVVASTLADTGGWLDAGAVSVFTRTGSTWSQTADLTIANNYTFNDFGTAVAISGDRIVATAQGESYGTSIGSVGYCYIFERSGGTWGQTARIANPNLAPFSFFGKSVAIRGDLVVVGHQDNDTSGAVDSGAAWLFRWGKKTGWVADGQLVASDRAAGDRFGTSVAVSDDTIVCGAPKNDTASGSDWGVAYAYAAAELTLTLAPSHPAPDQAIDGKVFRGAAGGLVFLAVEEISGSPVFVPLLQTVFAADNTFTFSDSAPNPALGFHVGVRAYKIAPTGKLVASELAYVDL
ncbi:MAG: FG-GAP repeat protein [Planctomycetes bacterium]|nr:FG-GAP repeat protein [Planctomycetota bacterium]